MKESLKEFIEKHLCFKPTPCQEFLIESLLKGEKAIVQNSYHSTKKMLNDEFTCQKLINMKINDKFALLTPKGLKVFKCIKEKET